MVKEVRDGRFILVDVPCIVEKNHVVIQDGNLAKAYKYIQQFTNQELITFGLKRMKQEEFIISLPLLKWIHSCLKRFSRFSPYSSTRVHRGPRGCLIFDDVPEILSFTSREWGIPEKELIRVNKIIRKLKQYSIDALIDYAEYTRKLGMQDDPFPQNRKIFIPNTIKIYDLSDIDRFMEQRGRGLRSKTKRETKKTTPTKVALETAVEIEGTSTEDVAVI